MAAQEEFPRLPAGFRFGTATSAYQVEGATAEDGRGPSIWDTFAAQPGRIVDGTTGEVAADHYHRTAEDVGLLRELGVDGYRFSVAWPRVVPTGRGEVNAAGLDFYDRLVDRLLEAGIEPMATLYHWDLPQALEDDGGWLNRATTDHFADYATVVADRLADRVAHWIPVNEPNVVVQFGYATGAHAPGRDLQGDAAPAGHHLLLAHGKAAIALRAAGAASVGCANAHAPIWPASDDPADVGVSKLFDALWNGFFAEAMLLGRYPADIAPATDWFVQDGDLATIRQPLDFYGVDYFSPIKVACADEDSPLPWKFREVVGYPVTDFGAPVVPDALREWLITFRARFRAAVPPIFVTECGASYNDEPAADGVVDDQARIDFLAAHLAAVGEAVRVGVDVQAFYQWSFLDDFMWTDGLSQRFGLVHVDHRTLQRTPKRSFRWYGDLIRAHRAQR